MDTDRKQNRRNQVFLNNLLIYEEERRKGYAMAALSEIVSYAAGDGCRQSIIYVWKHNLPGINLYTKCGYVAFREWEDGMIILITGASHTGKTALAQKLLEKYKYPYLSIDHLKMGLIRSGNTTLTPMSDEKALMGYLWPIVCEMIKTAIENKQNLIVEGCYIPFEWSKDFESRYLKNIKYYCLVMSDKYITNHFSDIKKYANIVENRMDDESCTIETVRRDNAKIWEQCQNDKINYLLIDDEYQVDIELDDFYSNSNDGK
ncbi:MAG: GNAT family N-acetyltransferase [Lachnospiraceae bacterium]|nr:GNAT family N-acetyltransferase [Lachnospiraceae bacterium]